MADSQVHEITTDINIVSPKKQTNIENEKPKNQDDIVHDLLQDLSNFVVRRVLRNNTSQKQVAVEGTFKGCDGSALVVLEKKVFPEQPSELEQALFNKTTDTTKNYRNDIYRGYDIFPKKEFNGLSATIIYPASPKHIEKFTPPEFYIVDETPELYNEITLPQVQAQQFSLQWVDNILDGTAEADRVIFDDKNEETGFVLVKDLKWNDEVSMLYLIAITRQRIGSIRDLNEKHLPLLKNIKEAGTKAILDKYNIPAHKLRIFFHYHPSYYHLHVHFVTFNVENAGTIMERAHLLSTVIRNIELMPDYYQKATLPFRLCKYELYKPYEDYLNREQGEPPLKRARLSI